MFVLRRAATNPTYIGKWVWENIMWTLLWRAHTMNWGHTLLLLLIGRGTQRFVCVCVCVLFWRSVLTFISKFSFGQSISNKSVMLLRMSLGTLWDLGGNLLGIRWESSVNNTLGTTKKKISHLHKTQKKNKIGPFCMHVEPPHYWPHENYGLKSKLLFVTIFGLGQSIPSSNHLSTYC
jgi:hypothetical protein